MPRPIALLGLLVLFFSVGIEVAHAKEKEKAKAPEAAPQAVEVKPTEGQKRTISTGQYVTGGILGSAVGFGIGHAVQRRYMPLGLIFSIGETAGLVALIADIEKTGTRQGLYGTENTYKLGGVAIAGLIVMSGLHIWEAIDVWVNGADYLESRRTVSTQRPSTVALLPVEPVTGSPGLTMALRF